MRWFVCLVAGWLGGVSYGGDLRHHPDYRAWVVTLQDGSDRERLAIVQQVERSVELGTAEPLVPVLRIALQRTTTPETAVALAALLATVGPAADAALPEIGVTAEAGILPLPEALACADALGAPADPSLFRLFFRPVLLIHTPERVEVHNYRDALEPLINVARRTPSKMLPPLLPLLQSPNDDLRTQARHVLAAVLADERAAWLPNTAVPPTRTPWLLPALRADCVRALRPRLRSVEPDECYQVALLIWTLEPEHLSEMFPILLGAATDDEMSDLRVEHQCYAAFRAFRYFVAALDDPNPKIEFVSRTHLAAMLDSDAENHIAVDGLRRMLRHTSPRVRSAMLEILEPLVLKHAGVRADVFALLGDVDPNVRLRAAQFIIAYTDDSCGSVGRILQELALCPDPRALDRRIKALELLRQLGPKARATVPALLRLARHTNPDVRYHVALALAHIDPTTAPTLLPAFRALLKDRTRMLLGQHELLLTTIAKLGPRARPISDEVAAYWRQAPNEYFGTHAAATLLAIDAPHLAEPVQYLSAFLDGGSEDQQTNVLLALSTIGAAAKVLLPNLLVLATSVDRDERLRTNDKPYHRAARLAIELDPTSPTLLRFARDRIAEEDTRWLELLPVFGQHIRPLLPDLMAALKESRNATYTKRTILTALGKLGPHAQSISTDLERFATPTWHNEVEQTLQHIRRANN